MCLHTNSQLEMGPNCMSSPRDGQEISLSVSKDGGHRVVMSRTLKRLFNFKPKSTSLKSLGLFLHLTVNMPLPSSFTSDLSILY